MDLALGQGLTVEVAEIQTKLGDVTAALKTVERLAASADRQKALSDVAAVCASVGDVETAVRLIRTITLAEVRDDAWIKAARSLNVRKPMQAHRVELIWSRSHDSRTEDCALPVVR